MSKLVCPCGFVHDLTPCPDEGWVTTPDFAYDEVINAHITQHEIAGHGVPKEEGPKTDIWDKCGYKIALHRGRLFECPSCGRIMWQKDESEVYRVFIPDGET